MKIGQYRIRRHTDIIRDYFKPQCVAMFVAEGRRGLTSQDIIQRTQRRIHNSRRQVFAFIVGHFQVCGHF